MESALPFQRAFHQKFIVCTSKQLARVVRMVDNAIYRINHYPADNVFFFFLTLIHCIAIYPVDNAIQPSNNWGLFFKQIRNADIILRKLNLNQCVKYQQWKDEHSWIVWPYKRDKIIKGYAQVGISEFGLWPY